LWFVKIYKPQNFDIQKQPTPSIVDFSKKLTNKKYRELDLCKFFKKKL